eukprot:gene6348-12839_t
MSNTIAVLYFLAIFQSTLCFVTKCPNNIRHSISTFHATNNIPNNPKEDYISIFKTSLFYLGIGSTSLLFPKHGIAETGVPNAPRRVFQTKSGLQYFDFEEGTGVSPRFGQLVSFHYTMYYRKDADSPLEEIDSTYTNPRKAPFLHKHGNGRVIRALDEAIHTMKPNGRRRAFIPNSSGYTQFGLGPLPITPMARKKLGDVLDLLEKGQGQLIFDVQLLLVADDENDQGFYEDTPISQEEVRKLVLKNLRTNSPEVLDGILNSTPKEFRNKGR